MWETFPIQTESTSNPECQTIDTDFIYNKWDEVTTVFWKDIPVPVKQWCISLWKYHFKIVRDGMDDNDLVGYIPGQGTVVAKRGKWIGQSKSRTVGYINYLFVNPLSRSKGMAKKLIETILHRTCQEWSDVRAFLFEVQHVPKSLSKKTSHYMCRFSYMWIPFLGSSETPQWKSFLDFKDYLKNKKGFIGTQTDWRAYKCGEDIIIFDTHDDIVWYSSVTSLCSFDGFSADGAYCRVFSPFGNVTVYAENMYFQSGIMTHYLLG
jgi:hypothetical protein